MEPVRAGVGVEQHAGGGVLCAGLAEELARADRRSCISNTDQGAQFTSVEYVEAVQAAGVLVSMDGRGRWMDNRFIERLWRSFKYEDLYLRDYEHGLELRLGVGNWFGDYNDVLSPTRRWATPRPAEVYRAPESYGARPARSWSLKIRPPMAVEKNSLQKNGRGKRCLRHPFSFPNILGNKKRSTKPFSNTTKPLLIFGGQWFENGDKLISLCEYPCTNIP